MDVERSGEVQHSGAHDVTWTNGGRHRVPSASTDLSRSGRYQQDHRPGRGLRDARPRRRRCARHQLEPFPVSRQGGDGRPYELRVPRFSGSRPRRSPSYVSEITADEQEKSQHQGGIEKRVFSGLRCFPKRYDRARAGDRRRYRNVHVQTGPRQGCATHSRRTVELRRRLQVERSAAEIQCMDPRVQSVAPDQTAIESSITFIIAKPPRRSGQAGIGPLHRYASPQVPHCRVAALRSHD